MQLPDGRYRKLRKSCDEPDAAHAFTFSCFQRQAFLGRDRARAWLAESIEAARRKQAFDLWAYVIMPEHVHLLLWPCGRPFSARSVLAAIKLPVARRAVAYVRREAPGFLSRMLDKQPNGAETHRFWQRGGGYDRSLSSPSIIHSTIDYIHANPVRRGLVQRPEDWAWSSAAFFAGLAGSPIRPNAESIPDPPSHWYLLGKR